MLKTIFLLPSWNWSYIIIGGAGGIITLLTLLYTVFIGRKNATIETLNAKNEWLQNQLDVINASSGDILTERLHRRIEMLTEELKRLSNDDEANKEVIAVKEKELAETSNLFAEVGKELGRLNGDYSELKGKYLCPTCGADLIELKDLNEGNSISSQRKYACGFTELDGEMVCYCPSDPEYPKFEEFELTFQQRVNGGYTAYMSPKTEKANHVELRSAVGRTKEEATENLEENYYWNPAILENENPPF